MSPMPNEVMKEMATVNYHGKHVEQRDAYKKALEDILKSSTVGEMVKIADTVLKANKE